MISKSRLTKMFLPLNIVKDTPANGAISLWDLIQSYLTINAIRVLGMKEQKFVATASQTAFVLTSYTPAAVSGTAVPIRVYRNGTRLTWVASGPAAGQFTYSGTTVTTSSSTVDDVIVVEYLD